MAYFPHAFEKLLVGTAGFPEAPGASTLTLTAGQIGIVDNKDHKLVSLAGTPDYKETPVVYLAQGSFHRTDKIGPFHGGYKETVKSKGINPKYVSKFYVVEPGDAQNHVIKVSAPEGEILPPNKTYRLRLDIKGSPALRFMTRNLYKTLDAFTGCPDGESKVDAKVVLDQWADQINEDVFLKPFISATVAAVTGGFELTLRGAYVDTKFGDCSFDPIDHHEKEPIYIYASALTEEGDPCDVSHFTVAETQEARQGKGFGETLVRDLILFKRYLQEPWQQDPRMREILDDSTLSEIDRSKKYVVYHILHSVPRRSNPSGIFDADQYLIKIVVEERSAEFETFLNGLLSSAGNAVQLEELK